MNEQDDILASTPQHPTNEGPVLPKAMEALVFGEMIYELLEYLDFTEITPPEVEPHHLVEGGKDL